jgi:hypothetical protein
VPSVRKKLTLWELFGQTFRVLFDTRTSVAARYAEPKRSAPIQKGSTDAGE